MRRKPLFDNQITLLLTKAIVLTQGETVAMDFYHAIHAAICVAVTQHLRLSGRNFHFTRFNYDRADRWNHKFLKTVIDEELFKPEEFRDAVAEGIVRCGLEMYDQIEAGISPDHVDSPEALAYAIRSGRIPQNEMAKIRMDDEPLPQFLSRADGLVEKILAKFSEEPESPSPILPHPCSCHHD